MVVSQAGQCWRISVPLWEGRSIKGAPQLVQKWAGILGVCSPSPQPSPARGEGVRRPHPTLPTAVGEGRRSPLACDGGETGGPAAGALVGGGGAEERLF